MIVYHKTANLILRLRRDPRLLYEFPPYISAILVVVGVVWLFLLPLNERQTYISENALLPGQVHTYFAGSEQNVFRGYRREIDLVKDAEYDVYVAFKFLFILQDPKVLSVPEGAWNTLIVLYI